MLNEEEVEEKKDNAEADLIFQLSITESGEGITRSNPPEFLAGYIFAMKEVLEEISRPDESDINE